MYRKKSPRIDPCGNPVVSVVIEKFLHTDCEYVNNFGKIGKWVQRIHTVPVLIIVFHDL